MCIRDRRNDAPFPLQIAEYRPDNCKIPITFRLKYDIIHLRFCFAPFCLVLTAKTAQNIQKSYGNRPSDRTPSPVQNIIFKDIPVYYITQNRRFQHLNHIKITHRDVYKRQETRRPKNFYASLWPHSGLEQIREYVFVFFSVMRDPHSGHFLSTGLFQNT